MGQEDQLRRNRLPAPVFLDFPCGSAGKESACNSGDLGSIPGLGTSFIMKTINILKILLKPACRQPASSCKLICRDREAPHRAARPSLPHLSSPCRVLAPHPQRQSSHEDEAALPPQAPCLHPGGRLWFRGVGLGPGQPTAGHHAALTLG